MATFDISKERIVTLKYYLSLRLERVETLKYCCVCRPLSEKFNIVSNNHGRTQKCNFGVLVCKTNFADHHTPDTINGFRDSVLLCKMQTATVRYAKICSISIPSHKVMQASKCFRTYLALHILILIV